MPAALTLVFAAQTLVFFSRQQLQLSSSPPPSAQILMFSYGSGAAGSMFSLRGRRCGNPRFSLDLLSRKVCNGSVSLQQRM